ncbi:protein SSUH2 homolog isoform X1 [Podarcis raffonei]|uniref:protein SSUH2 homolog isoform X1 n=2 Tax=Podarcis raffonei TaxID=65483 RepID=UPI002329377D|nr:protein SSUH2 homolog isoform X1 [Podarcis raffonei]
MADGRQGIRVPTQTYGTVGQTSAQWTFGAAIPRDMAQMPGPYAPTYNTGNISGYEGTTAAGGKHCLPPPNLFLGHGGGQQPPQRTWNVPAISEDEAKEAFIQYASSKCCYSTDPAKEMVFNDLQLFNTYRYKLETFTESRSSEWKTEPYGGGAVDSYLRGTPPLPWDMRADSPGMFREKTQRIRVPHTSALTACPTCGSTGRRHCNKCNGNSKQQCGRCHGRGVRFVDDTCDLCLGSGLENCQECSGMGKTVCNDCEGKGQLLSFIELQVEWQNNVYEYVADERSGFPIELFKTVTGETLFVDDSPMVYPVISFPDFGVSQASSYAVEQHQAQFASTRRILRQRQTIELILLTRVQYLWHGKPYSFYVYGKERKVHAEDYPQKCCCTIL